MFFTMWSVVSDVVATRKPPFFLLRFRWIMVKNRLDMMMLP